MTLTVAGSITVLATWSGNASASASASGTLTNTSTSEVLLSVSNSAPASPLNYGPTPFVLDIAPSTTLILSDTSAAQASATALPAGSALGQVTSTSSTGFDNTGTVSVIVTETVNSGGYTLSVSGAPFGVASIASGPFFQALTADGLIDVPSSGSGSFTLTPDEVVSLSGTTTLTAQAAIPEASTWVMMILGFGGLGYVAYGRRRMARFAA